MPNITATSRTLDVPGARLHYEVRGLGPVLMLIGLPMASTGFAEIAPLLADEFTVVTYDPRGIARSTIDDPGQDSTPELVTDDVHRVLAAVTADPAYVFGSSGGAVTGLALVSRHPEQVRTLVAHEPPLAELLSDRAQVRAGIDDIYDTYCREGQGAAWPKFFALAGFEIPADDPARAPAVQEAPSAQDLANGERMLAHCLRPTTLYRPDLAALRAASSRIVVAGGATSKGQLAHRTTAALAEQLGTPLVEFPGDHAGFVGQPEPFARVLRRVLAETT